MTLLRETGCFFFLFCLISRHIIILKKIPRIHIKRMQHDSGVKLQQARRENFQITKIIEKFYRSSLRSISDTILSIEAKVQLQKSPTYVD